ncbi:MAG: glycosyl hydrolase family 28-related protein [Candidatus Nitrosocaldaceae archaeon]
MSGENNNSNSQLIPLSPSSSVGYGIHRLEFYAIDRLNNRSSINSIQFTSTKVFNVKDYGAKGDGITDDTQAIRNTIEQARQWSISNNNNNPVTVYFPSGTYITGQLVIYSNMTFLGAGSKRTILRRHVPIPFYFRPFPYDDQGTIMNDPYGVFGYPNVPTSISTGHLSLYYRPFIKNYNFMNGNTNISIIGLTINGNGYKFERNIENVEELPTDNNHALILQRVDGIYIEDVKVEDSNHFNAYFRICNNVRIKSLYVDGNTLGKFGTTEVIYGKEVNHTKMYQDGVHFTGTTNVDADFIHVLFASDDAIAINGARISRTLHTEASNIHIKKAIVNSRLANGLRIHNTGDKDTYNIRIDTLIVNGYGGHSIDACAMSINAKWMSWSKAEAGAGRTRDIEIGTIIVKSLGYAESDAPLIHIWKGPTSASDPNARVSNVKIGEVRLELDGTAGAVNSRPVQAFYRWGIRISNSDNIQIDRFSLMDMPIPPRAEQVAYEISIANCSNVRLSNGIIRRKARGTRPHISIRDSSGCILDRIEIPKIDTNDDGIPDSNQSRLGLWIRGTTKNLTAINCAFATDILYEYDSNAIQYQGSNTIDIRRV